MHGDLNPDAVLRNLTTTWLGHPIRFEREVDSTNTQLVQQARLGGSHGCVLVADGQTQGHGRMGRRWNSPAGLNIYCSVLLRPTWPAAATPLLSLVAGVAVADTVEAHLSASPQLKWPNDVYFHGRKLAGILAEAGTDRQRSPYVVLGIGLNVNQRQFPPGLDGQATSLALACGRPCSRSRCLAMLLNRLEFWIDRWQYEGDSAVTQQWVRRADWLGKPMTVRWGQQVITGTAMGIHQDGALRLQVADGTEQAIHCGDASIMLEAIGLTSHPNSPMVDHDARPFAQADSGTPVPAKE